VLDSDEDYPQPTEYYASLLKSCDPEFIRNQSEGNKIPQIPTPGVLQESDGNPTLNSGVEGLSDVDLVKLLTFGNPNFYNELRLRPQVSLIIN
jgi:hypothetical protein